ncbi:ATP-dependent DNA ligase [Streptomyces sp. NPDC018029]|uniref:ATP-dependent DNA ligase n=1 Tax=Streptomyces sp. NPDC018029 TaxID=3365032 RepID=UPI0037B37378
MEYPLRVALAGAATTPSAGPGWWYEPKLDGDRAVVWRRDTVRVQTRSGRDATAAWIDIATAAMDLPPDTVLDGEAVLWRDGRTDFGAVRSRTSARGRCLADLIHRYPASYVAFDCLMLHGRDLRGCPYLERRAALLEVLEPLGPPLQAVPATDDVDVALAWYEHLPAQGIEGIVAKAATSTYRPMRAWKKIRHAETVDAEAIGYVGPAGRPRRVAVLLPDGRRMLSQALTPPIAVEIVRHIAKSAPGQPLRTDDGETYTTTGGGLVVEVESGTTRHATVAVVRVR